jgi:hypothetical protein
MLRRGKFRNQGTLNAQDFRLRRFKRTRIVIALKGFRIFKATGKKTKLKLKEATAKKGIYA